MDQPDNHAPHEPVPNWLKGITVIGVVVLAGSAIVYFANFHGPLSEKQATWGAFGDFVGGATAPILSLLALIALLYTIKLQLKELHATQAELKNSTTALQAQNHSMRSQLFENSFFAQLRLLNEIVSSIDFNPGSTDPKNGRDCFVEMEQDLKRRYATRRVREPEATTLDCAMMAYLGIYTNYKADLAHYYRLLYNIARFTIDESPRKATPYIRLLRSQVSNAELVLLFYNALSEPGEKSKELFERLAMFDNLDEDWLLDPEHRSEFSHTAFSSEAAFGALPDPEDHLTSACSGRRSAAPLNH